MGSVSSFFLYSSRPIRFFSTGATSLLGFDDSGADCEASFSTASKSMAGGGESAPEILRPFIIASVSDMVWKDREAGSSLGSNEAVGELPAEMECFGGILCFAKRFAEAAERCRSGSLSSL
jgi:hypothetical protein